MTPRRITPTQGEPVFSCQKPVCECAAQGIHPRACMDAQKSAQTEIGKVVEGAAKELKTIYSFALEIPDAIPSQYPPDYRDPTVEEVSSILLRHLAPLTARLAEVEWERDEAVRRAEAAEKDDRISAWMVVGAKLIGMASEADNRETGEQTALAVIEHLQSDLTKLRGELEEAKKREDDCLHSWSEDLTKHEIAAADLRSLVAQAQSAPAQKEKDGEEAYWRGYRARCEEFTVERPEPKNPTLWRYLDNAHKKEITFHTIGVNRMADGGYHIYIHPQSVSGETEDYLIWPDPFSWADMLVNKKDSPAPDFESFKRFLAARSNGEGRT